MLTQRAVAPYLMRRGLVAAESLVDGDLVVADVSRRNRNFKVVSERAPSYLLKQGAARDGVKTVAHEAAVYRLLQPSAGGPGFEPYLPRFFGYDPEEQALVIEFLRDARNLHEYHERGGRFPAAVGAGLGAALAALHRLRWSEGDGGADHLKLQPPWVLSIHRPNLETLPHLSSASLQAIKIIQRFPEFGELLDGLRRGWVYETPIHFDIKWENCLVAARRPGGRKVELKIVDWELAGVGDPCWDVGSVFNDYLGHWLSSIPITGETPPERFVELARHPLERMRPALRSFWEAYALRMGLDAAASADRLLRGVRYAAARLTQTVHESLCDSARLTGHAVCSLQLSLNILRRPREAAVQLLGIPPPGEAAP